MDTSILVARREARRKRILENSENRLQKIIGRHEPSKEDAPPIENEILSNFNVQKVFEEKEERLRNGHIRSRQPIRSNLLPEHLTPVRSLSNSCGSSENITETVNYSDEDSNVIQSNFKQESIIPSRSWLFSIKIHFIVLAIFVRILYLLDLGFLYGEVQGSPLCIPNSSVVVISTRTIPRNKFYDINVVLFVPALILQFSEWALSPSHNPGPSLLGLALVLSGLPQQRVTIATKILGHVSTALQNLSIYLVAFVICHQLMALLFSI